MKIITNDKVYVQKGDLAFLTHTDLPIPASIFMKVFGDGIVIIDNGNRFEFVKFENVDEIEFFRKLDWIIEYNSVKDLSEDEIIELGKSIAEEKNNIAKKYNAMSLEERKKNSYLVDECEMLEFKMFSLRDTLWFMQGQLKFVLPEGIENLKSFENKKEKGLRKILSRFRKK